MVILRRDVGEDLGDQQFYVYFKAPADVSETTFLVWKHPQAEDDRWLYLPALDLVRRIAASDERTSFVGSHFFYEDVSGRSPLEDEHELIEVTERHDIPQMVQTVKAGDELVVFGDDFADKNSTLMSPKHFKEFFLPGLKRAVAAAHEAGA